MSRVLIDDLGEAVTVADRIDRVVCLVPSLTEAVAVTAPGLLVGATDWCTHPPGLDVVRVRGTKNPDRRRIQALAPDLVIANQEENRRLDVERLRAAGVAVWVTVIESVQQSLRSMRRLLVEVLTLDEPAWLADATAAWAPAPGARGTAVVCVWREPWIVVGATTFTGDLVARLGLGNPFGDGAARYPHVDPVGTIAARPDVVILPDEPYVFTPADGPEAFPGVPVALVPGRLLTWYGPSLSTARTELTRRLDLGRE